MKPTKSRQFQKGFTLIEIMIVLAVLAIMAAIVVPNVGGFLTRGKDNAYKADQRMLQAAVDAWRSDTSKRSGNPWPVLQSTNVISIPILVEDNYLRGANAVSSAAASNGGSNSPLGSYVWGINTATGVVTSTPSFDGNYP